MTVWLCFALFLAFFPVRGIFFSKTFHPANDPNFVYTGRWQMDPIKKIATADWPCTRVQFNLGTETSGAFSMALFMDLSWTKVKVVVTNDSTGTVESERTFTGGFLSGLTKKYHIKLENTQNEGTTYSISVIKLTEATPYAPGIGKFLTLTSVIKFIGVKLDASIVRLEQPLIPSRRINFIGSSDTAGSCIDGTPETLLGDFRPLEFESCDAASTGLLGRRLKAEISVQAISGIGITQNAFADIPLALGKKTMPDLYGRTLQTEKFSLWRDAKWNFASWRPDLIVVSLGSNDFNNQLLTVPSEEEFRLGYENFLLQIVTPYLEDDRPPTIVSICGQGDPTEAARNPSNDRCRPCPNVEEAINSFQSRYGATIQVEYIFIPCDGTVVTGFGDIGCSGHKNRLGHERVADFLEPKIREIMAWTE